MGRGKPVKTEESLDRGIVVQCPVCGLVFVQLWLDEDDIFTCPSCNAKIFIGQYNKDR